MSWNAGVIAGGRLFVLQFRDGDDQFLALAVLFDRARHAAAVPQRERHVRLHEEREQGDADEEPGQRGREEQQPADGAAPAAPAAVAAARDLGILVGRRRDADLADGVVARPAGAAGAGVDDRQ